MIELYKRIKELRLSLGLSQEELAIKVGYKDRTSIAKIEKGLVDLSQSKIIAFAEALQTTTGYLMGDDFQDNILNFNNIIPLPKTKKVPILGTIACGQPILAEQNMEGFMNVSSDVNVDFCLICKGNSMINARIFDGDIVYIKQQPQVENGEIAAILIDNEATLKRVFIAPDKITLRAENPTVNDIVITGEEMENVKTLGKAVFFFSSVK